MIANFEKIQESCLKIAGTPEGVALLSALHDDLHETQKSLLYARKDSGDMDCVARLQGRGQCLFEILEAFERAMKMANATQTGPQNNKQGRQEGYDADAPQPDGD